MSGLFTPPALSTGLVLYEGAPGQSALSYRLFRHYGPMKEGINVYLLSDDTITEADPDGTQVVWNATDQVGISQGAKYVKRCFYGGCDDYPVSDAESALLVAAGYSVH